MDETREILGVGQSRPPEVLDHPKGWERGPAAVVRESEFADGDDGGVSKGFDAPKTEVVRLFGLTGEVYAGDVSAPGKRCTDAGVATLKEGLPVMVEEPSIAGHGDQAILREEQWVIATEAEAFGLYVALVVRVVAGDGLPVELKVALDAVLTLELDVGLLDLLKEGMVIPSDTVVYGGNVGVGGHGAEVTIELVGCDVLAFIDLEDKASGVAEDIACWMGAEK